MKRNWAKLFSGSLTESTLVITLHGQFRWEKIKAVPFFFILLTCRLYYAENLWVYTFSEENIKETSKLHCKLETDIKILQQSNLYLKINITVNETRCRNLSAHVVVIFTLQKKKKNSDPALHSASRVVHLKIHRSVKSHCRFWHVRCLSRRSLRYPWRALWRGRLCVALKARHDEGRRDAAVKPALCSEMLEIDKWTGRETDTWILRR